MQTFSGAWPALVTPFTKDEQVNVSVTRDLIEYHLQHRASGFYVCGSTGEGIYMSVAERKLMTETVVEQVNGRVPVIIHVGSQVAGDAIQLAAHAQASGANGISSIIPANYAHFESIGTYFGQVADAASTIPFLPYLFTSSLDPVALMHHIKDIPNLAGTKYTGPNMYQFRQILDARSGAWSVFSGMDEQCIFAAMFGACGNIGSTLNVMPGIYRDIHQAYQDGDLLRARDLQLRANRVTETLISFDFMGALKAALLILGFDCGQPRLPAMSFPDEKRDALKQALDAVDFSEIAAM
ncbi:MAG: dihydrodipicolinate synthase family protein [Chloroflexota bacterium]